jgi:hypothetical protein
MISAIITIHNQDYNELEISNVEKNYCITLYTLISIKTYKHSHKNLGLACLHVVIS